MYHLQNIKKHLLRTIQKLIILTAQALIIEQHNTSQHRNNPKNQTILLLLYQSITQALRQNYNKFFLEQEKIKNMK
jgi:hypothetical protein